MKARARARRLVWLRRCVQAASLALFVALLLATRPPAAGPPTGWLGLYFHIDPLVLVGSWLGGHRLVGIALLALATFALTLLLGRVFCGWLCPLGALHNALSWLGGRRAARRAQTDGFSRWQRAKYWLLAALLVMVLGGAHWVGIVDPQSLLYRSLATGLLPAVQWAVEASAGGIFDADPHLGPLHLTALSEPLYRFCRDRLFAGQSLVFAGGALILFILIGLLLLNLLRPRFWCRYLCPLGALLGACAGRTALRLTPSGNCGSCQRCLLRCPAAAQPEKPGQWLPEECFGCWNCVASCGEDALDFRWQWPWRRPEAARVDVGRRALLGAGLAGIGALFLFKLPPLARGKTYNPELIRPPGALAEPDFLARCVQCGLCMKACPTGALQPAFDQAGLAGLWTPVLVPRLGYCDHGCALCGQVCPTGAIQPLALAQKQALRIGLATLDTTRCLPFAYGRECIVCEEHCPVPTKAIYFVETEVELRGGERQRLKQPRVDAALCTGCGICETKCPFADRAAIRVTSAGESRHPANQPLLPGALPLGGDVDLGANPYGG